MDRLGLLHVRDGNGVGLYEKRVLVFVRQSTLRVEALDAIEKAIEELMPLATSERPCGALSVVPANAGLSRNDLLTRQRRIFSQPRHHENVFIAFTVLGDGAQAAAMRAVVRLFALGQSRMKMFATTDPAIEWLAPRVKMPVEALLGAIREVEASISSR